MTFPPGADPATPMTSGAGDRPDRIVVGVDGSLHSAAAVTWALRQARLTGAAVELLACWRRPIAASAYAPAAYVDIDLSESTRLAAEAVLAAASADIGGVDSVPTNLRVVEGYPPRILVSAADGAGLLVVGSRGHGELSGVLLGSVGLHCATHATCPVVIVHDPAAPASL